MADFDSLIDLITTTVAPDSWDDVGGPGSIAPFEGGVRVNVDGVLNAIQPTQRNHELARRRKVARRTRHAVHDPWRPSELRKISLPRLEHELRVRAALGQGPSDVMEHLAGLRSIRFVFLYPDTGDIVIAGPAGAWQRNAAGIPASSAGEPVMLLDDLVTLLRNARTASGKFGCSIDPRQENLARTQAFLSASGSLRPNQTRHWVDQIRERLGFQGHYYVRAALGFARGASFGRCRLPHEADWHGA